MFVIKKFQTTCSILLTECAKDNVPYLLATAANRSRIKRESEYNIVLSLTNIFQKTNFIWSIWYVIGMLEQKYCNGLTLSRQHQLKICLKQLFQVTFTLLRVLLHKTAFSQPYVNVGKQYVLTVTQLLCLDTSRLCYAKFWLFIL